MNTTDLPDICAVLLEIKTNKRQLQGEPELTEGTMQYHQQSHAYAGRLRTPYIMPCSSSMEYGT